MLALHKYLLRSMEYVFINNSGGGIALCVYLNDIKLRLKTLLAESFNLYLKNDWQLRPPYKLSLIHI